MANILSVSAEPDLLYTRGLLLERTGAFVKSAPPDQAISLLKNLSFDVVVLCHSLTAEAGSRLCREVRRTTPHTRVLLIESPLIPKPSYLDADDSVSLEDGPGLLVKVAGRLLPGAAEAPP